MYKFLFVILTFAFIISCRSTRDVAQQNARIQHLIDSIENRPIDTTRDFVEYLRILMKYPNYGYLIDEVTVPWLAGSSKTIYSRWIQALLGSYIAGFFKESETSHSIINSAFSGNIFGLKTYNKLKEIDTTLKISHFDSLNHADYRIRFQALCRKHMIDMYGN